MTDGAPLERFASWDALVEDVAERIAAMLATAVRERGRAVMALSGGSTPAPLYRRLSRRILPWSDVTVTLTDERWVAEASSDSNARLLRESLLQAEAAAARVLPLKLDSDATPDAAAARASAALGRTPLPFDLVLLGMGADGHFASLFPGSPALAAGLSRDAPACIAVPAGEPAPSQPRLTLSLPVLSAARSRLLVIRGEEKLDVLTRAAKSRSSPPVAVLLDRAAPTVLWAP